MNVRSKVAAGLVTVFVASTVVVGNSPVRADPQSLLSYAGQVGFDEPIAYWRLDERVGTVADEVNSTLLDATYSGQPGSYRLGEPSAIGTGSSVYLDGSDGYVFVAGAGSPGNFSPEARALSPKDELSVELWFKPDVLPNDNQWHMLARWRWFGWGLRVYNGKVFGDVWEDRNGTPVLTTVQSPQRLTEDEWYHVVLTKDADAVKLFLNGSEVSSLTSSGDVFYDAVIPDCCGTGGGIGFGRDADVDAFYFRGWLDEIAVYDKALPRYRTKVHSDVGRASFDPFVTVALGDSYSSGEGAPPFENGTNNRFNDPQENTLTARFGGDSCHRSLINYAKLNVGRFEPEQPSVLVDRTCSGALIEPPPNATKVPIAGAPELESQVTQAVERLDASYGLAGGDVDVVTLTAGGNDAKFGDIVLACIAPTLARELFRAYPETPGEVEWFVKQFGSCGRFDGYFLNSDEALDTLLDKQLLAQADVLEEFPNAEVMQLTYPSIVPDADAFGGDTCNGIRQSDASYARGRVTAINDIIRESITQTSEAVGSRLKLVELENAFGENALCPTLASDALVTGIEPDRLRTAVAELAVDPLIVALLDSIVAQYEDMRTCIGVAPFTGPIFTLTVCNQQKNDVVEAIADLRSYLVANNVLDRFFENLASGASSDERYENSRNLFHPNARGVEVMACQVLETYRFGEASGACAPNSMGSRIYQWDGADLDSMAPRQVVPGQAIPVRMNGFDAGSTVSVRYFSDPIDGAPMVASPAGEIAGDITIPESLSAGVHRVEFSGTIGGQPRSVEVLIEVEGQPLGGASYSTYLAGFVPGETVTVTYGGLDWVDTEADTDGGVVVDVPMVTAIGTASVLIEATGQSGAIVVDEVTPIVAPAVTVAGASVTPVDVNGDAAPDVARVAFEVRSDQSRTVRLDATISAPGGTGTYRWTSTTAVVSPGRTVTFDVPGNFVRAFGPGAYTVTAIEATDVADATVHATLATPASGSMQSFGLFKPDVSPILECVAANPNGTFTARFGYENREGFEFNIPSGSNNKLTGTSIATTGPVTTFKVPGVVPGRPGRTQPSQPAFTVTFATGKVIVWKLGSRTSTASVNSARCAN